MSEPERMRWFEALRVVLDRSHLWTPEDMPSAVAAAVAGLGLRARIWLVDHEQVALRALVEPGGQAPEAVPIDGSLPGRAFARVESMSAHGGPDGTRRWWVPMLDGTDRLGLLEIVVAEEAGIDDREFMRNCELFAGLVGHLVATISRRGDHINRTRRTRPMSTASELLGRLLPPLTSSTDRVVPSAVLQPCYQVGGDGFDYVLDGTRASPVILDAVGRGLTAGRRMPLGIADHSAAVADLVLEPDDRLLLHTDGVTEARTADGDRFGVDRLVDLAEQHEGAGLPAPETLRRLAHAVVGHQSGPPTDDATLMLVHWSTPAALNTVPKSGQGLREDHRS